MRKFLLAAAVLSALPMLSGCAVFRPVQGKTQFSMPVGVGGGPDQLKRTPCACAEIPQKPGLPNFLEGDQKPDEAKASGAVQAKPAISNKTVRGSSRA